MHWHKRVVSSLFLFFIAVRPKHALRFVCVNYPHKRRKEMMTEFWVTKPFYWYYVCEVFKCD